MILNILIATSCTMSSMLGRLSWSCIDHNYPPLAMGCRNALLTSSHFGLGQARIRRHLLKFYRKMKHCKDKASYQILSSYQAILDYDLMNRRDSHNFWKTLAKLGQERGFLGQKQCLLGKKCNIIWYILHIILN